MEFVPYKVNEVFTHKYIQVPKELFFNEFYKKKLNSDSKILYAFLLDRLALSIKNNWTDENGNTYLIYTRKDLQELLDLSDKTVTKAFKQLKECNLIFEKRQGKNKPNLIAPENIKNFRIGRYGKLRLRYLKEQKKAEYTILLMDNKLQKHLMEIDKTAHERFELLMKQFAEKENITEELKAKDQLKWVGLMNNIKHSTEEIILKELIYI